MDNSGKILGSDELLEKIFYYMNMLFEEKDFSKTIVLLTDLGRTIVNADRASFWFWDKQAKQYWTLAASDNGKIVVEEGSGIVGVAISANETIVINNPYEDKRFNPKVDKETGYITKSILCMPVRATDGEVIGAYQAINKFKDASDNGDFDDVDVKRLSMAAAFSGKALESYLLQNEVAVDPLTGLKNRRGFREFYNRHIIGLLGQEKVSIIMCDIDHFKKVNDTYGHNAGDQVLIYISRLLMNTADSKAVVVRWGGEEFIIMLPKVDIAGAIDIAEDIRSTIEKNVCPTVEADIPVTMSFGVCEMDAAIGLEDNVKRADDRLYQAKNTGRNKVVH